MKMSFRFGVNLASSSSVSKIMVTNGDPGTCSPLHRTLE